MKKHITPEQLQELSPEQQEGLRDWWKPQIGDVFVYENKIMPVLYADHKVIIVEPYDKYNKEFCLPLLSIGQCIELLGAEKVFRMCQGPILAAVFEGVELIDALWNIVKLHLSKNIP